MNIILYPPNTPIAFYFNNIAIRWYSIFLLLAILFGIGFIYNTLKLKYNKQLADLFFDITPSIIITSIIGARFFYVIGDFNYYFNNPLEIILINHGGLSIYGAIIFGIFGFYFQCKKRNINFLKLIDVAALAMPMCQAIGRWGNFFNQEAFGLPSDFIIKMYITKQNRPIEFSNFEFFHPAFLYESILDVVIFIFLNIIYFKKNTKRGTIFFLYLMLYSLTRILIENIRIDSVLNIFSIPVAILISILIFCISLCFLILKNLNMK